jgi:hypothetical protein
MLGSRLPRKVRMSLHLARAAQTWAGQAPAARGASVAGEGVTAPL